MKKEEKTLFDEYLSKSNLVLANSQTNKKEVSAATALDLQASLTPKLDAQPLRLYRQRMKKVKVITPLEALIETLANSSLNKFDFEQKCAQIEELRELQEAVELGFCKNEFWQMLGLNLSFSEGKVSLQTRHTPISEQTFCITDIETTGGKEHGQIIEIGAVKVRGGVVCGEFKSLIYAPEVPQVITNLTGIDADLLKNAPSLRSVLSDFRTFLGDSVFVAHNVGFDYSFVSQSLDRCGFGKLFNRKLCTVNLARRTLVSPRYGLDALKELLDIHNRHHRAFSDAVAAREILRVCLGKIPDEVKTSEELINFSLNAPTLRGEG